MKLDPTKGWILSILRWVGYDELALALRDPNPDDW
jgi:hypothetical protein